MRLKTSMFVFLLVVLLATMTLGVNAAKYPNKTIELVVPFAAGGTTDMGARALAISLEKVLDNRVIVVNKPGGSSLIGNNYVANQARADGYTLCTANPSPYVIFPHTKKDMPFDARPDFIPICQHIGTPIILSIRTNSPWDNINEVLEYARANPGKLTVANPTTGGQNHLAIMAFFALAGVEVNHIPMGSGASAQMAVLEGSVDAVVQHPSEGAPTFESGETKPILTLSPAKGLPDVPTPRDIGVDYYMDGWMGISVPAGTPDDIVLVLRKALKEAIHSEEYLSYLERIGDELAYLDQPDFIKKLDEQHEIWGELVEMLGLKEQ